MALKYYKPATPSVRHLVSVDKSSLWKGGPEKSLVVGKKRSGGRNSFGRITSWKKGGGSSKKYRLVDFKRVKKDIPAKVVRIEYDPNRTAFIALIRYEDGVLSYIIAPQKISSGDTIIASAKADIIVGNALPLRNIPIGTVVHNVEMKKGKGGQLARSAGAYAQLVGKDSDYALLKLRSGEVRKVDSLCMATVGVVSNPDNQNIKIGKAGRSRWLGIRPTVRGVVMNPIDHPHGGGEGKTSGGRHPVSPWGKPAKGGRIKKKAKSSLRYVVQSRHKKK